MSGAASPYREDHPIILSFLVSFLHLWAELELIDWWSRGRDAKSISCYADGQI
ncbi:hypothetical protein ACS0TY_028882 [Phlomoides rotata]